MLLEREGNGTGDQSADILRLFSKQTHISTQLIQCYRCTISSNSNKKRKLDPKPGDTKVYMRNRAVVGGG